MLHDIGMSVDYDDHHKHSRYLILNAGLPGFDPREVALVAQAARYHRKGMPNFGELAPLAGDGDEARLDRLSILLRLAEDLERSRDQSVRAAHIAAGNGTIRLELEAEGTASVERWAAQREVELFDRAFGKELQVQSAVEPHPGRRPARPHDGGDELHDRVAGAQDPLRARRAPPARLRRRHARARHPPRAPAARDRDPAGRLRPAGGPRPDAARAHRRRPRTARSRATRRTGRCASATTLREDAVWGYEAPIETAPWLQGYVALYPGRVDRWLVEDEPVAGGLRDPYHRVDVHTSSRPVKVTAAGELIAQSTHPTLVFETSMPVRAYLPRNAVEAGHLRPSDTTTTDPYIGDAIYWHVHAGGETLEDAAHSYELPRAEAMKIAGLVCFSGEGVEVELDAG